MGAETAGSPRRFNTCNDGSTEVKYLHLARQHDFLSVFYDTRHSAKYIATLAFCFAQRRA